MLIAGLSDIHIGLRQYSATTEGRNAREVDVENAWFAAVDKIIEAQPDLVLIGGDIFHHCRVGIHAVRAWRDGVRKIIEGTKAHLVAIQGNHDSARVSETLSPIIIPDDYERVHIVLTPKRINLQMERTLEKVSIACFPFETRGEGGKYALDPSPGADVNCVLIHAAAQTTVEGSDSLPRFYAGEEAVNLGREADRFNLILAGDYHIFHRLHPTAMALYPGALERTTSNIWQETGGKGFVLCDTDTKELKFVEVPTRAMYDYTLANFDLEEGVGAESVNVCLSLLAEKEILEDALVRFKVDEFPKDERVHIDWALVRAIKHLCLHFEFDVRYAKREIIDLGDRRERAALTLAEEAVAFFKEDPEEVRGLLFGYMGIEADVEDTGEEVEACNS